MTVTPLTSETLALAASQGYRMTLNGFRGVHDRTSDWQSDTADSQATTIRAEIDGRIVIMMRMMVERISLNRIFKMIYLDA